MKIGEFSRITGVNIPTIRYYIQRGILVPDRDSSQYDFNEFDLRSMELIVHLKRWGFSLEDIHRLLSLKRFSTGCEVGDRMDYIAMLTSHRDDLQDTCKKLQVYIDEISSEIAKQHSPEHTTSSLSGVPLAALNILCCPHCGSTLQINHADMDSQFIFQGILHCKCGYTANIRNGIIYSTDGLTSNFDKADINRSLYRSCPSELLSLVQKSYNWMTLKMKGITSSAGKVVMETHLNSFFYLYKHLAQLNADNFYIISDKFSEIIELYKGYIDQLNLNLNILYIVSPDSFHLPIKSSSVDVLIDYNSTNEHGIFSRNFYLEGMYKFLKPSSFVLGTYYYFDSHSDSIKNLNASYPENDPENYTLDYFKKGISKHYRLQILEPVGISLDSGPGVTFVFHKTCEKLYIANYLLKPLSPHPQPVKRKSGFVNQ